MNSIIRATSRLTWRPNISQLLMTNNNSTQQRILMYKRLIQCSSTTQVDNVDNSKDDILLKYLWLKCTCHETATLDSYEAFVRQAAIHLGIDYVETYEPSVTIKRKTLLASRHVHKKYRVQYEHRTYNRNIQFKNLTGSTADTFLEYVERNLPEGVLLVAEQHRLSELPFDDTPEEEKVIESKS